MPTLIETIAGNCFPLFDRAISLALDEAHRHASELRVVCSGVYEVGPRFADGGVCIEALRLPLNDVSLGAGFYLCGRDEKLPPVFRVSVGWHRSWTHDRQAGFSLPEYSSVIQPKSLDEARLWVGRILPRFERSLKEALARRQPPSRLRHAWQRFSRRVLAPSIMTHPIGRVIAYPDLRTFSRIYDKKPTDS